MCICLFDLACSHSALMQLPSDNKLLFMFAPSCSRAPVFFVFAARSEPARSIRESLAIWIWASIPCALSLCSTVIYRTACDLDDASFAAVYSLVLFLFPILRYCNISSVFVVMISLMPATQIPLSASSRSSSTSPDGLSKSLSYSL